MQWSYHSTKGNAALHNDMDKFSEPIAVGAVEAALNTEQSPYLGDPEVVDAILRTTSFNILDQMPKLRGDIGEFVMRTARDAMQPFLGLSRHYVGMNGWNKAGAIDTFLQKWTGASADTPIDRVAGAFAVMFSEILDVANYAVEGGVRREDWDFQVDDIFDRYTHLFMGVSPDLYALIDKENENVQA